MLNAEKFKETFGLYATELWSMPEEDFLKWLNSEFTGRIGEWLENKEGFTFAYWVCSECGYASEAFAANKLYHYCPRCGVKMRGGK